MLIYPDVQIKAQEEIDRVLGSNQLPTFEDEKSLPYLMATVKETLRWHPVAPLPLPHVLTQEDEYKGYVFPTGSLFIANSW